MNDECGLIFEIKKDKPVELIDLTNSLFGVADEYRRFLIKEGGPPAAEEIKLYVKKISSSNIVAELITASPGLLPIISYAKNISDFSKYLKMCIDFCLGKITKDPELEKNNYENINNIIEPVAKDKASQLNCSTIINGDVNFTFNVNSIEANAIQNDIRKRLESMKEPLTGTHKKVLLYWYQARNDPKSAAGDRAIIESIYMVPVKVIMDEEIKADMLAGKDNPFKMGYIVDVEIQTIKGRPAIYKITRVYEKINLEDDSQRKVLDE
jgi:hypothetical protein